MVILTKTSSYLQAISEKIQDTSPTRIVCIILIVAVIFVIALFIVIVILNMNNAKTEIRAFSQATDVDIDFIPYFKTRKMYFLWNILYEIFYHTFRIFAILLSLLSLITGAIGNVVFSTMFTITLGSIGLICTIITVFINLYERAYIYRVVYLEYGGLIKKCNAHTISTEDFVDGIAKCETYITAVHYGIHLPDPKGNEISMLHNLNEM